LVPPKVGGLGGALRLRSLPQARKANLRFGSFSEILAHRAIYAVSARFIFINNHGAPNIAQKVVAP